MIKIALPNGKFIFFEKISQASPGTYERHLKGVPKWEDKPGMVSRSKSVKYRGDLPWEYETKAGTKYKAHAIGKWTRIKGPKPKPPDVQIIRSRSQGVSDAVSYPKAEEAAKQKEIASGKRLSGEQKTRLKSFMPSGG